MKKRAPVLVRLGTLVPREDRVQTRIVAVGLRLLLLLELRLQPDVRPQEELFLFDEYRDWVVMDRYEKRG